MSRRPGVNVTAGAAVALALLVTVSDLWLALVHPILAGAVDPWLLPVGVLARLAPVVVGALIVIRRNGNRVGWTLLISGVLVVGVQGARVAAIAAIESGALPAGPVESMAYLLAAAPQAFFGFIYAWPVAIVLLFPDGRPGRLGRWCFWGILAACAVMSAAGIVRAPVTPAPYDGEPNVLHVPVLAPLAAAAFTVAWLALWGLLVTSVMLAARRLQRAAGERLLQLRWLTVAAILPPISLIGCVLALLGVLEMGYVDLAVSTAQLLVVAAVFIAITKHGLYGIEQLINRALVYATLTPLVVAVFVVVAAATGRLLGAGSPWVTALATAAAAAVFLPARARAQRFIDRRLAPRKVAAVARLRDYARRLHHGDATLADVVAVLGRALDDPSLRVYFVGESGWRTIDDEPAVPTGNAGRVLSPVRFAGAHVATVEHVVALTFEPELLRVVLRETAATLAMARLQLDVQHQLREVQASRDRIVQAGHLERRRLERDLHDGAQQRLVALGIALRRLQHSLPVGATVLAPALDDAVRQVGEAIRDLRTIAAGIRPARLDDGLRAALDDLAQTSPVPVEVHVPDQRLPTEVEAAAYFIACEAVTNAVKHAAPSRVVIEGSVNRATLRVSVSDDGRGGAAARADGGGLSSMADRARACGGSVAVTSQPGNGTTVEMVLPCG
ncbi:histidine kinase [Plantactinospora sp. ZYX-F-223]|uniref:sensor histidine kinase n=1 Tax=Plantactinospora sp. ZYX-F-223 TaxID=3144103 RepID=UPI0031FD7F24